MKKLSLLLVLFMLVSLSACGGEPKDSAPKDSASDYGFVKVTIPAGWEYVDRDNSSQVYLTDTADNSRVLQFTKTTGTAQSAFDRDVESRTNSERPFTVLSDKTFGEYTYLALEFLWNGNPSLSLRVDVPSTSDSISVSCFELSPDDPIIAEILNTVTYIPPAK